MDLGGNDKQFVVWHGVCVPPPPPVVMLSLINSCGLPVQ